MSTSLSRSPLETYRDYLRNSQLGYQYSPSAQRAVFFPRLVCPFSGDTNLEWRVSRGVGTVHATTVVFPRQGEAYNVALVDLDEGFRMMSRVEGLAPQDVKIGMRVAVQFADAPDEPAPLPIFVQTGETA